MTHVHSATASYSSVAFSYFRKLVLWHLSSLIPCYIPTKVLGERTDFFDLSFGIRTDEAEPPPHSDPQEHNTSTEFCWK